MDRAKEFLSTISHEIRTPLTSIKGFSKTILESYDNLDDIQKKKFIKIIYEQSQRLINLIENALTAASAENRQDDFVYKKTDINKILIKSIELVKMNYKNMEFKTKFEENLYSFSDTDKLQQIFVNLLDNACKYSKNSNIIEIKTYILNNQNHISIKNFGASIQEKDKEKIFEKFYRTDDYLTSKTQGSGLGLYIVKMLTDAMNGEIEIKSENNPVSTEFITSFPIFKEEDFTKAKGEYKIV